MRNLTVGTALLILAVALAGPFLCPFMPPFYQPGERALATAIAELPTPTPTLVPPLSVEYGCTNPDDLNRFSPGDTVRVARETYLVENPSQSRPIVTGVVQAGDILIVHGNDNGVHCTVVSGILYYGVRLNNASRPPAFGFFHPEDVEE